MTMGMRAGLILLNKGIRAVLLIFFGERDKLWKQNKLPISISMNTLCFALSSKLASFF
jgi:hypothetical protein